MFYVYELIDPRNGMVFYVGKGSGKRAFHHVKTVRKGKSSDNPHKDRKIAQILESGNEVEINFLYENIEDEEIAYRLEEDRQNELGIESLTNICLGARPPRVSWSDERKELGRIAMTGNTINLGRIQSDEEKNARSKGMKRAYAEGRKTITDKERAIISATHKGKQVTDETRAKISESRKGKSLSELWGEEKANAAKKVFRENGKKIAEYGKSLAGKKYDDYMNSDKVKKIKEAQSNWAKYCHPNRREIIIEGVTYCSISEAHRATGISKYIIGKYYK